MHEIGHELESGADASGARRRNASSPVIVRRLLPGAGARDPQRARALHDMYAAFGPGDARDDSLPLDAARQRAWLDRLLECGTSFVATSGPDAIAHLALLADTRGGYEVGLWLHPERSRRGVARALLGRALAHAAEQRASRLWLLVPAHDAWLRATVRAAGFRRAWGSAWEEEWAWRPAWLISGEELLPDLWAPYRHPPVGEE